MGPLYHLSIPCLDKGPLHGIHLVTSRLFVVDIGCLCLSYAGCTPVTITAGRVVPGSHALRHRATVDVLSWVSSLEDAVPTMRPEIRGNMLLNKTTCETSFIYRSQKHTGHILLLYATIMDPAQWNIDTRCNQIKNNFI